MTIQVSADESSFYSDPSKSPRCAVTQSPKVQQETVPSSPSSYPLSTRAYNKKDYNYIASFPRVAHVGTQLNRSKTELLQCQEMHMRCTDGDVMASSLHAPKQPQVSLPELGAWNAEASMSSVEGYTDAFDRAREQHVLLPEFGAWNAEASPSSVQGYTNVFDRVREQKRGGSISAQSLPKHLQTPVRGIAKDLAVAQIPSHVSTHHRKWSSNWSRCFVSPVTTE